MNNLLERLKQARQAEQEALSYLEIRQRQLEETVSYKLVQDAKLALTAVRDKLSEVDEQIRQQALDLYGLTRDKHPFEKVSIAVSLEPIYEEKDAIAWAINNALDMLKLDSKMFEKHAKAVLKTVPLPFVKVEERPMVKIAREL